MNIYTQMMYSMIKIHGEHYAPIYNYYKELEHTFENTVDQAYKERKLSEFLMNYSYEEMMRGISIESSDMRYAYISYAHGKVNFDQLAKKLYKELVKGQ